MSAIMNFDSAVYVNEQLNRLMVNAAQELAQRSIKACAEHYNFDAEEALRLLGLINVKLARSKPVVAKQPKEKVTVLKPAFPMPYNGECAVAGCCSALRQNQGLYTQCTASVKGDKVFCKQCQVNADKNDGVPEYGTIQQRQAVGIFEYVDPKGRKPVAYTKVMKKYKIDQDKVLEEAGKFNIVINSDHFVVPEADSKRGRPKAEKAPKEKGAKGRPKKAKKVLQIEGDEDDLFATLVADANAEAGDNAVVVAPKKKGKTDEEKEAERIAKENEKKEKEAKRLAEKAAKELKAAEEKAAKELKAAEEKAARELKKKQEEDEKAAKKAAAELAKKEKEAKLAADKAAKEAAKTKKPAAAKAPEPEADEEPDVVKKIEVEGKKYLKSKKTGIVYDYNEYVKNGEQVVIGKWNDAKNKIDFNDSEEEAEEEYEM